MKKLYKVTIMRPRKPLENISVLFALSRTVEVAAIDAAQAIRKVKYNLTQTNKPLVLGEFIDEVTRLGIIEVK